MLASCAASEEYLARLAEVERTIPICATDAECEAKWSAARSWVIANADFSLRTDSDTRIDTLNADSTRSGTAVQVDRVEGQNGEFQIVVDVECFAAYGCPSELDMRLDFNRTINAVQ
ncbi:MAG: hypothetical protein F4X09_02780 [Gammaproteobacteria bacterium]|nr:hypothetical protein [Gammaproteobacteria bacterium]MYC59104.1 hypothetical protein [Gammaproteobacteria bacterium]MYE30672.1 hypothetical protein [Gammaproteobacteria bacterium]MYI01562.1 hypothetical protein [Gammaproteobacteria bacterium]